MAPNAYMLASVSRMSGVNAESATWTRADQREEDDGAHRRAEARMHFVEPARSPGSSWLIEKVSRDALMMPLLAEIARMVRPRNAANGPAMMPMNGMLCASVATGSVLAVDEHLPAQHAQRQRRERHARR